MIRAPDDVTVTVSPAVGGNPTLTLVFNYTDASLLNGQAHGIDSVSFIPLFDSIANANGLKATVEST